MEYAIIFLPLIGSIIGYLGRPLTKFFSEITTSIFVSLSAILSIIVFWQGIQNNKYGMGTSIERASAVTEFYKRGESFGIPGLAVNGMNPISVYVSALKAVKWVRDGNGPIILEMKTYRYRGHSMSDPAKYRTREEVQKMREEQDPIEYIKKKLLDLDITDKDRLQEIDDNIRLEISNLAEKATNSKPVSEDELFTDVLCEEKYE